MPIGVGQLRHAQRRRIVLIAPLGLVRRASAQGPRRQQVVAELLDGDAPPWVGNRGLDPGDVGELRGPAHRVGLLRDPPGAVVGVAQHATARVGHGQHAVR